MTKIKVLFLVITSVLTIDKVLCDDKKPQAGSDPPTAGSDGSIERAKRNQLRLYEALHHFALPDADITKPVNQRFILQIPGKVLNPADYHPGDDYEKYLKNPHKAKKEMEIPPMVMEKMFQISDVIPGTNTLTGGETGFSLARIYESILGTMDVVNFEELNRIGKSVYEESLDKLLEPLPDPDDSSKKLPLLQLYTKFQDAYHNEQRKMEDAIKEKKENMTAVDYQLWFQRHFHILNAQVEGAYTRWLLYGRKHLVESYIAHFDITSSGEILEDARVKLRAAGFSSLDRSQIVYPVSFTPSNWYKYLENKEAPLTRDQLLAQLESVKTRITLLKAMRDTTSKEIEGKDKTELENMKKKRDEGKKALQESAKKLESSRRSCWFGYAPGGCGIATAEGELSQELSKSSAANLKVETLEVQVGAKSAMRDQIDVVLAKLELERETLEVKLKDSKPPESSSLVDEVGTSEQLDLQEIQDNWAMFDFSSTKAEKESSSRSFDTSSTVSAGYFFLGSASVSSSYSKKSFSEHVKSSDVKVKAKLLKVKINRPWFRSDLFMNREFTLQRESTQVSPGPMTEKDFNSLNHGDYLLYQYPTAFLLAKDVTMEFSGLDADTKQTALSASFGVSAKGGWGPFSFGGSSSTSSSSNDMRASSTADGLRVQIPGVQLIGYYCDVVPKFPNPLIE